jgi:ParB family chromosome partitioning protein
MRHDAHFVEELATQTTQAIGEMVPIGRLRANPNQPRQGFEGLEELVASIQRVGVLEPLLVRRSEHGFQIVSGERRFRAARAAGLEELPCIVMDLDDARALEIALIENLQRQDLSPFEEAEGLQALIDQFGLTHDDIAARISKSRSTVTETLSLSAIPRQVRARLEAGDVRSKSLLLELTRAGSAAEMAELAERIINEGLTRDDLRRLRREGEDVSGEGEEVEPEPEEERMRPAPPTPPRRLTFRSKRSGITVTVYLSADQVSLSDIERSLLEAIRNLRSNGIPD